MVSTISPIDQRLDAEPVLVERPQERVDADRPVADDGPLVGEERQPATHPQQDDDGASRDGDGGDIEAVGSLP